MDTRTRREAGRDLPLLLWRFSEPVRAAASSPHGGGLGVRRWIINAQVPSSYSRRDPDHHLAKLAVSLGLAGKGVGMLTAADVLAHARSSDGGVDCVATVGLSHPTQAAAPEEPRSGERAGTINIVAVIPASMSDGALVNAVATATEAKVQALRDLGLAATGTATDAVCVVAGDGDRPHAFGGPRSLWGARLARAVYASVLAGGRRPPELT